MGPSETPGEHVLAGSSGTQARAPEGKEGCSAGRGATRDAPACWPPSPEASEAAPSPDAAAAAGALSPSAALLHGRAPRSPDPGLLHLKGPGPARVFGSRRVGHHHIWSVPTSGRGPP